MQNREELRKKGHDGSRKMTRHERGKNIIFRRSGGINIVFGPKKKTLALSTGRPKHDSMDRAVGTR